MLSPKQLVIISFSFHKSDLCWKKISWKLGLQRS